MVIAASSWLAGRFRVAAWLRGHAVTLLRVAAVVVVFAVTLHAGFTCHGLVGPPG